MRMMLILIAALSLGAAACEGTTAAGVQARSHQQFTTSAAGQALVPLAAGSYIIIPDSSAPIVAPTSQQRAVTVRPDSITTVTLHFDTGIR